MGEFVFKLPDVGEGLAEAELVEWNVDVGDPVKDDEIIASVMTDKATVEIPSPVEGKVAWLGGKIGDVLAIGADFIRFEVTGEGNLNGDASTPSPKPVAKAAPPEPAPVATPKPVVAPVASAPDPSSQNAQPVTPRAAGDKPLASPAVRRRAQEAGVDLRRVAGSGPANVISHDDLDRFLSSDQSASSAPAKGSANTSVTEIKIVGLRRKIAEKMVLSKSSIPHITYVEEIDMTKLEELRETMNSGRSDDRPRLTLLPFLMHAVVRAVSEHPEVNATYDDAAGVVSQYGGVHIGVATQTDSGLVVPVLRHAETNDIWAHATELLRLSDGARAQSLKREELSGSSITITSLGPMGGIVTTPVINHPEVAIVGVNKMLTRPLWDGSQFVPRKMMNVSASFDHRIIDGWVAATFVQKLKTLLETPAMIFIEG